MTRINLGILPSELCDQMLVAEYRELPRTVKLFSERLVRMGDAAYDVGVPSFPTLGAGHVLYFINYGKELQFRHMILRDEMYNRGINVSYSDILKYERMEHCPIEHYKIARPLLIDRIKVRLSEMKRKPTWTNRVQPTWAGV